MTMTLLEHAAAIRERDKRRKQQQRKLAAIGRQERRARLAKLAPEPVAVPALVVEVRTPAPLLKLHGRDLDEARKLRRAGWSFAGLARRYSQTGTAITEADVALALGERWEVMA